MEYIEPLITCDGILDLFTKEGAPSYYMGGNIYNTFGGKAGNGLVTEALHKLIEIDKYITVANDYHRLSGTAREFIASGGYKALVDKENRKAEIKEAIEEMGLKSAQSVIDTNTSIQGLNTKTNTFYTKQTRYNNVQIFLTIAILLSSAIYTTVAVVSYNESKRNSIKEQRLEELEKTLKDKTTKDSIFQKAVKDSLNMK